MYPAVECIAPCQKYSWRRSGRSIRCVGGGLICIFLQFIFLQVNLPFLNLPLF